ncbi:MarR family transcriptional regulator [Ottowia sp. GY511]|uniref:MarR family winged helix-turn-helix transcriptional regulator n=1 Tax=Ottowia flava TaxID=2675430 RepID=A0ABW4KSI7_9BURK|nr:MarR family transcriptional regulator [Ottowia sp. GY511]TXK33416.1 MarR family transcriptional regulator [Ottowia sp. GY511]
MPADSDVFSFEQAPGHLIRRAHQISVAVFSEETAAFGVTPVQFAILSVLAQAPDIDQITLAQRVAFDQATIGSVVARLIGKGWLHREPAEQDRRRKLLRLTPEGLAALHGMTAHMPSVQTRIVDGLSLSERTQFMGLLAKLVAHHERETPA